MRKKKKGLTSYYYSLQSIRKSAKNKRNKVKWRHDKALQVASQSIASSIAKHCMADSRRKRKVNADF